MIDSQIEDVKNSLLENLQTIRNKLKVALKGQNEQIGQYEKFIQESTCNRKRISWNSKTI